MQFIAADHTAVLGYFDDVTHGIITVLHRLSELAVGGKSNGGGKGSSMIAKLGVGDLFFKLSGIRFDDFTGVSAENVGGGADYIITHANAVKCSACHRLIAVHVGMTEVFAGDRFAFESVFRFVVYKRFGVIGSRHGVYVSVVIVSPNSRTAYTVHNFGHLLIFVVGVAHATVITRAFGHVAVEIGHLGGYGVVSHGCRDGFGIGVLVIVLIRNVILNTVERDGFHPALAVIGVANRVVTALHFGNQVQGVGQVVGIRLALLGAVGNGRNRAVLGVAVGELTAVGQGFGADVKNGLLK